MRRSPCVCVLLPAVLLVACGSDDSRDEGGVDGAADGGDDGDGGDGETSGGSSGDSGDGGDGGDDGGTGSGSGSGSDDTGGGPKFDVGDTGTDTDTGCGEGDGDVEFSYIWIANSGEGTVSKIDTRTAVEVGRYRTAATNQSPSRTSVDPHGDVAVLNRGVGDPAVSSVVKIAARVTDCIEKNGQPGIQTSTGPGDVLAYGEDECILWDHTLGNAAQTNGGARALAWDAGQHSEDECHPTYRLWTGWRSVSLDAHVRVLDGTDGTQIGSDVVMTTWLSNFIVEGPYGGATDAAGDFWTIDTGGRIIHVDSDTFTATPYSIGPDGGGSGDQYYAPIYGVAIDSNGDPWVAGFYTPSKVWRFDVASSTFQDPILTNVPVMRGMAIDTQGMGWVAQGWTIAPAHPCALVEIDTTTNTVVDENIPLPGCGEPVGISIDFEDYVWVVDRVAEQAYKVDPDTHAIAGTVTGLVEPYTYSDMTGIGLSLVNPPG